MKKHKTEPLVSPEEWSRLHELTAFERAAREKGYMFIGGTDEAGRGPLAGPVVAAVCFIPETVFFPGIDDSKKLTAVKREELFVKITTHPAVKYAIADATHHEIDLVNIHKAGLMAMCRALEMLMKIQPIDFLLVDGLKLPDCIVPYQKIIKGDAKSQCIAAASILAKVTRDRMMDEYHDQWPDYGFNKHKGYATKKHFEMLKKCGPCPIHRQSFEPVRSLSRYCALVSLGEDYANASARGIN